MRRRVAILGSTGSIGVSALDVCRALPDRLEVIALSTNTSVDLLRKQVAEFRPRAVCVCGRQAEIDGTPVEPTLEALVTRDDVDVVLLAVVGAAGIAAAMAAVTAGKTLAVANKESLVAAGELLVPLARRTGATILPVDSEHSALFQAFRCGRRSEVARAVLTASGVPFRDWPIDRIDHATVADALNHPTWRMGVKNTIDSATMVNKGLELIEACRLFDLPEDQIDVQIHPTSVVHSLVEFVDGSVIAQLSPPDMKLPIQYALTWPQRVAGPARKMDWSQRMCLSFEPADAGRYPALGLARDAARAGGTAPVTFNAADEVAVTAFLAGHIRFGRIAAVIERTLEAVSVEAVKDLPDVLEADGLARRTAEGVVRRMES